MLLLTVHPHCFCAFLPRSLSAWLFASRISTLRSSDLSRPVTRQPRNRQVLFFVCALKLLLQLILRHLNRLSHISRAFLVMSGYSLIDSPLDCLCYRQMLRSAYFGYSVRSFPALSFVLSCFKASVAAHPETLQSSATLRID